eukprot:188533_1
MMKQVHLNMIKKNTKNNYIYATHRRRTSIAEWYNACTIRDIHTDNDSMQIFDVNCWVKRDTIWDNQLDLIRVAFYGNRSTYDSDIVRVIYFEVEGIEFGPSDDGMIKLRSEPISQSEIHIKAKQSNKNQIIHLYAKIQAIGIEKVYCDNDSLIQELAKLFKTEKDDIFTINTELEEDTDPSDKEMPFSMHVDIYIAVSRPSWNEWVDPVLQIWQNVNLDGPFQEAIKQGWHLDDVPYLLKVWEDKKQVK